MNTNPSKTAGNRFVPILAGCYALWWILLAIHPVDRGDWLLENLLVFAAMAMLVLTYRKFQFSNLTYALLALFLALHAVGAHYTYAKVPAGFWIANWLGLDRNHFDRAIHFGFGLLFAYPLQELLRRAAGVRASWVPWLALAIIIAMSSFLKFSRRSSPESSTPNSVRPISELKATFGMHRRIWSQQCSGECLARL